METDTKEHLLLQHREEEKGHAETKNILLRTASELEDIKLRIHSQDNDIATKEKLAKELLEEKIKLQTQLAKAEIDQDSIKLEKEKGEELIKKLEEFYKGKLQTKKEKKTALIGTHKLMQEQSQAAYEDLYTRCADMRVALTQYMAKV